MPKKTQNKAIYRQLCKERKIIPHLFSQPWWLDVVSEKGEWEVILAYDKGGNVIGALPYYQELFWGIKVLKMPKLTPFFDVWMNYPPDVNKVYRKDVFEKQVMAALISQLPSVSYFSQKYHYSLTNWLPFFWQNYQQTTRYTLVLEHLYDLEKIFANFSSKTRTKIRSAEKNLIVEEGDDVRIFWRLNEKSFQAQNKAVPYTLEFFLRLDQTLSEKQARKIFYAFDGNGNYIAAIYLVWDEDSSYCLATGVDRALPPSYGAVSLLIWHAIQYASTVVQRFDFEGSMLLGVERFFRAFGSEQKPYFQIYKSKNRFFESIRILLNR